MEWLIIGLLFMSCGKSTVDLNAPDKLPEANISVDIEDSKQLIGFDYDAILKWCTGKTEHKIDECYRDELGVVCEEMEEEKEYLISECYYDFDLSALSGAGDINAEL